jgi:hypothetical protein
LKQTILFFILFPIMLTLQGLKLFYPGLEPMTVFCHWGLCFCYLLF